jgi:hypothetical protein
MPFSTELVDDGRRLLFTGSGLLTGREIIESKTALLAEGARLHEVNQSLVDLVAVSVLQMTTEEVRTLAGVDRQLASFIPVVVIAVVAPSDHVFGVARMWEVMAQSPGWRTAVFRTRPEADAWLRAPLSPGS